MDEQKKTNSLLESAIADAKELKETARKAAEEELLEKYSDKIRDTMNSILEGSLEKPQPEGGKLDEEVPVAAVDDIGENAAKIDKDGAVGITLDEIIGDKARDEDIESYETEQETSVEPVEPGEDMAMDMEAGGPPADLGGEEEGGMELPDEDLEALAESILVEVQRGHIMEPMKDPKRCAKSIIKWQPQIHREQPGDQEYSATFNTFLDQCRQRGLNPKDVLDEAMDELMEQDALILTSRTAEDVIEDIMHELHQGAYPVKYGKSANAIAEKRSLFEGTTVHTDAGSNDGGIQWDPYEDEVLAKAAVEDDDYDESERRIVRQKPLPASKHDPEMFEDEDEEESEDEEKEEIEDLNESLKVMSIQLHKAIEEINDLHDYRDKLKENNSSLKQLVEKYKKQAKKHEREKIKIHKVLQEAHLKNGKLFYMNQALCDSSLNEAQKKNIVQQIQDVDSTKEAKRLYESFSSASQAISPQRAQPQSLHEAVNRGRVSKVWREAVREGTRAGKSRQNDNPQITRWKKLAGI